MQRAYLVLVAERRARDEGAGQTSVIMAGVKRARLAREWSAQRLADEMSAVGVPWNADIVVNLEHGRRKSLRVHELLALAVVLAAESPVDLLAPPDAAAAGRMILVTPNHLMEVRNLREWCDRQAPPPPPRRPPGEESTPVPTLEELRKLVQASDLTADSLRDIAGFLQKYLERVEGDGQD